MQPETRDRCELPVGLEAKPRFRPHRIFAAFRAGFRSIQTVQQSMWAEWEQKMEQDLKIMVKREPRGAVSGLAELRCWAAKNIKRVYSYLLTYCMRSVPDNWMSKAGVEREKIWWSGSGAGSHERELVKEVRAEISTATAPLTRSTVWPNRAPQS